MPSSMPRRSATAICASPFAVMSPMFSELPAKLLYIALRVALDVSMLICFSVFAAVARTRNDAGNTYVMISRPLPKA